MIAPLRQQLKAGQRLVIAQAWNKCKHDRKLVKASPQDVNEAFAVLDDRVYDEALHEPFVGATFDLRTGDRAPLLHDLVHLAAQRGHAVQSSPAGPGHKPYFLLRACGPPPLLNYSPEPTRLAAAKKTLGAEASATAQAVAHRRSGRHFFLELFRGAAPHRTVEGQELMDEPGVFDFSWNGRRYLTSSKAVANAFTSSAADGLVGAVLEAMQKRLRTTTCRSVCEEKRPPKARRPASLPGPREPGEQIALDIFDVFDAAGARFSILHAVDGATKFQMAVLVVNKSSAEVVKFLRERWAPVFSMPRTIVCDQGQEFIGIELEDFASQNNIFLYHIAVQAP